MKQLLLLMRLFFVPFNGWPWLYYVGLALLPVVLVTGLFFRAVAFGLAIWDYTLLLAIPFTLAPKILRMLLCNRQLIMVPGMQRKVILALLLFTLLQSVFIAVFVALYANVSALPHFRNAALLFAANSLYIVVMQYAVTTRLAVMAISIFPLLSVAVVLLTTQGMAGSVLTDPALAAVLTLTLGGWLAAWSYTGKHHQFRKEHESLLGYKTSEFQRPPLAEWLLNGGDALAAPDATLLLGYPANLMTRCRVTLYAVFLGPAMGTLMLVAVGFGKKWELSPSALEVFIGSSLLAATFSVFQGVEWVARLRLIWLRRHVLRDGLWQFLEKQMLINLMVLMVFSLLLACAGLLFTRIPATLMLHYPLLVLLFNSFYGYYVICARTSAWSPIAGIVTITVGSGVMGTALWMALKLDSTVLLHGLEVFLLIAAANLRLLARVKLFRVDWLVVKPTRSAVPQMAPG